LAPSDGEIKVRAKLTKQHDMRLHPARRHRATATKSQRPSDGVQSEAIWD
jgi:hypothetical protein